MVLGSGGARGIAHIAVIEELEKEGYEIIEVIGCSMGAVVGGIYAAGRLPEYKKWLTSLTRIDVFDLLDFTFTKQGFVKGERLFAKHVEVTGELAIEEFPIPFTAVATDMKNREEVHFNSGDLYKALRASVSIPGFFVPVIDEGRVLVDGGVLNPLPVNLVNKKEEAIIVAVNLNGKFNAGFEKEAEPNSIDEMKQWFEKLIPESIIEKRNQKKNKIDPGTESYSLIELMDSTFNFTQDRLTELMVAAYPPDYLIEIPRNTCGVFDFDHAAELLEIGKEMYAREMGN